MNVNANEALKVLESIREEFEEAVDLKNGNADYYVGECGFSYRNNNRDFEVTLIENRSNIVIVIDFHKENQTLLDIEYSDIEGSWMLYSHQVHWVEKVDEIKTLQDNFVSSFISEFADSVNL